ncbi:hypothetical protein D3C80_1905770 [compost metagenome]
MLFLEKFIISLAISTSLTLDSAACKFSEALSKFEIVCSSLFCKAPSLLLSADTVLIAVFIVDIEAVAFA